MVPGLAAAAAILVAVSVLLVWTPAREEPGPTVTAPAAVGPARIVSMMSLRIAYREGGEEGLEAQLDKALKDLGWRPKGLSTQALFEELGS